MKILNVEIEICGQCPYAVTIPGTPASNMRPHRICKLTKKDVERIGEIQEDCPLPNAQDTETAEEPDPAEEKLEEGND